MRSQITPLIDLPVGENFQDQATSASVVFSVNKGIVFNPRRDLTFGDVNNYLEGGAGTYLL